MNDGSFLVSDGYCNSRVLRYKPDGAFVARALPSRCAETLTWSLSLDCFCFACCVDCRWHS
jgi:hypothetical protein